MNLINIKMNKTLDDDLRSEFKEIVSRKEFKELISLNKLDLELLYSAFDTIIEDVDNDKQYIAFQNRIISTLKQNENK